MNLKTSFFTWVMKHRYAYAIQMLLFANSLELLRKGQSFTFSIVHFFYAVHLSIYVVDLFATWKFPYRISQTDIKIKLLYIGLPGWFFFTLFLSLSFIFSLSVPYYLFIWHKHIRTYTSEPVYREDHRNGRNIHKTVTQLTKDENLV